MVDLLNYLSCFNKKERSLLLKFLTFKNSKKSKKYQLLNHLLKGKVNNDHTASNLIYGDKPNTAYYQLKKRLKEDILHYLLLKPQLDTPPFISEWQECNLKIIQAQRLLFKQAYEEGNQLLQKAWKIATKNEYYGLLFLIHETVQKFGMDHVDQQQISIIKRTAINQLDLIHFQEEQIGILPKKKYTSGDSSPKAQARCKFWQSIRMIQELISERNFPKALIDLRQLESFVEKFSILQSPLHKWEVHRLYNELYMLKHNYPMAYSRAHDMQKFSLNFKRKSWLSKERTVLALFHQKKYESAYIELIKLAARHSNDCLLQAQIKYFMAIHALLKKDFCIAFKHIQKCQNDLKPKAEWHSHSRILEIIILILKDEYDLCHYRLDSLRKYQYNLPNEKFSRIKSIYKLLNFIHSQLPERNLDSIPSLPGYMRLERQLKIKDWNPLGPEVIRIERLIFSI